jgi:CRISPR system Cascade subunit CasC
MNLLELHLLTSHAVFCGNRDDLGRPKRCQFGGVKRARISSQCLKRAMRMMMQKDERTGHYFQSIRTKQIANELADRLAKIRADNDQPEPTDDERNLARGSAHALATVKWQKDADKAATTMFFSLGQYDAMAQALHAADAKTTKQVIAAVQKLIEAGKKKASDTAEEGDAPDADGAASGGSKKDDPIAKVLKPILLGALGGTDSPVVNDAADIALFGRMVASHSSLNVEAAAMFSHAISTHEADIEPDFYTAVDDQQQDETGADMMGHLEFTSAVYYNYIAVNLDLLFYQKKGVGGSSTDANLTCYADEGNQQARREIIGEFIRSALQASPSGRKYSMNSDTLAECAYATIRKGQPLQLINAFEKPIRRKDGSGLVEPSVQRLATFKDQKYAAWGIKPECEGWFSSAPVDGVELSLPSPKVAKDDSAKTSDSSALESFISAITSHVP